MTKLPRCFICKRIINSVLPLKCKCDKMFCKRHRYPEHDCSYDYKKETRDLLNPYNPVIKSQKFERI